MSKRMKQFKPGTRVTRTQARIDRVRELGIDSPSFDLAISGTVLAENAAFPQYVHIRWDNDEATHQILTDHLEEVAS